MKFWIVFCSMVLVNGCASSHLAPIDTTNEPAPVEIMGELREKFTVNEPVVVEKDSLKNKNRSTLEQTSIQLIPVRRSSVKPIRVGERAVYDVGIFGMTAGHFVLQVLPYKEISGRKVYHLHARATTSKVFSMFYELDDTIESFLDYDGLFSHRLHLKLKETKQVRDSLELHDSSKQLSFVWNRGFHESRGYYEKKELHPIPKFPQDGFSALYFIRTLNPMTPGTAHRFQIVAEGRVLDATVTVVRREEMRTPMGKIQTIVVEPETGFHGVLEKRGGSLIWLTDDDRRLMVRMEAKIRVGTLVVQLSEFHPEKGDE